MKAAVYRGPGDIRIEERSELTIDEPTDAVVRVTHTAICGSDLWFYRGEEEQEAGEPVGHEPSGIVEDVGEEVQSVEPGGARFRSVRYQLWRVRVPSEGTPHVVRERWFLGRRGAWRTGREDPCAPGRRYARLLFRSH